MSDQLPSYDAWLLREPQPETEECPSGGEHAIGNWMPYTCKCGAERCADCDEPKICETCTDYCCPTCAVYYAGYFVHDGRCRAIAIEAEEI